MQVKKLVYLRGCEKDLEKKFPLRVRKVMVLMLKDMCREPSADLDRVRNEYGFSGYTTRNLGNLYRSTWEIRKQDGQHFFRLAYSNFRECVFALHAFLKKTNQTEKRDRDTILERAKIAAERHEKGACH